MRNALKEIALPAFAIAAALLVFGVLVWFAGVSPVDVWVTLFKGPLKDNKGKEVLAGGKVQKQTDLELEKMNYLVEGVQGSF